MNYLSARSVLPLLVAASCLFLCDRSVAQRPPTPPGYGGNAYALIRVFSPAAELDLALTAGSDETRLIQKYPRNAENSAAPLLNGLYFRQGSNWVDWQESHAAEATRLRKLLKRGDSFTRVAFNKDKTLVALGRAVDGDLVATEVLILSWPDLKSVVRAKLGGSRFIDDVAWMKDSKRLLVLQRTERTGLWPWELFAAAAGHPIPHNSLYLARLDLPSGILSESDTPLVRNVTYAFGWLFLRMRSDEPSEPTR